MNPKFQKDSLSKFKWEEYEDGIHIVDYHGGNAFLYIPETIEGKPVVALSGEYDSVYIPACVKHVADFQFQDFTYTTHTPSYCIEIDPANPYLRWENGYLYEEHDGECRLAFSYVKANELTIDEKVTVLGKNAFICVENMDFGALKLPQGLKKIESLRLPTPRKVAPFAIPESVEELAPNKDLKFSNLENNPHFTINGDAILSADGKKMIAYKGNSTEFTVPESVEEIMPYAFDGATALKKLMLSNVKRIHAHAFRYNDIKTLRIPASLEVLDNEAFFYGELSSVLVDKKNKYFYTDKIALYRILENGKKELMFCFRAQVEEYTMDPDTVSVLDFAFNGCPVLKKLILSEQLGAFDDSCLSKHSQTTIVFTPTVKNISISQKLISPKRYVIENHDVYFWEDGILYERTEDGLIALRLDPEAETATLKDGVVTVQRSFADCAALKTAVCPSTLRRIEKNAFANSQLETITLNEGLVSIGENAFENTKLKSIHLPATLENFKDAFGGEASILSTCTVAKESPLYCAVKGAVYSKDMKNMIFVPTAVKGAKFEIPDTVEEIGIALQNCTKLKEIVLGASIRRIPDRAFRYCHKLQRLICNDALEDFGDDLFSYHAGVLTIQMSMRTPAYDKKQKLLEESLTVHFYINEMGELMDQYPEYSFIPSDTGVSILKYKGKNINVVIPEKLGDYPVTGVIAGVFSNHQYQVESIELPDTLTELPPKFFEMCNNLKTVKLPQKLTVLPQGLFIYCHHLKEVVIPEGVTRIEDAVFFGCDNLEKIVFPASVTEISEHIFSDFPENGLPKYRDLYLSDETMYYVTPGSYAEKFLFDYRPDSYKLSNLNVTYADDNEADGTAELLKYMDYSVTKEDTIYLTWERYSENTPEKVTIPSKMMGKTVSTVSMNLPTKLKELEIPETVTSLADISSLYSWLYIAGIQKITIHPENPVYYSDGHAIYTKDRKTLLRFAYAESGEYSVPEGTEIIGEYAFASVPHLRKVTLPKTILEIKTGAFNSCGILDTVEGMEYVTVVQPNAFDGTPFIKNTPIIMIASGILRYAVTNKRSYVVPEGIKTIANNAFALEDDVTDDKLEEIVLPSTLTAIEPSAFRGRKRLVKINLPEGLRRIGEKAFYGCISLESLTLPSTLCELGNSVFPVSYHYWRSANAFTAKMKEIKVASGNPTFSSVDGILCSADGSTILACPCAYPKSEITLPDTISTIAQEAFFLNDTLQKIHLPASVKRVERKAFGEAKKLETINMENVEVLEERAFADCSSLMTISLSVKEIPSECFQYCSKLSYVALNGTEKIGSSAFYGVPLTAITFPETLKIIEEKAFSGNKFKQIILPKSVESVGSAAFPHCPDITAYDAIDADLKPKAQENSRFSSTPRSSLGYIGVAESDYEITVRSAETDEIKYKVWMGTTGNTSSYVYDLAHYWGEKASFNFKEFDDNFGEIKGLKHKVNIALNRLRYPVDLTESAQKAYVAYITRMAKDVMRKCIDEDDMDTLMLCETFGIIKKTNIDEMLDYAVSKQQVQFSAYFIDYKNTHFQSKKDPMASFRLDLDKPSKDWKTSSSAPNRVTRYQGNDTMIEFPTEIKDKKIFGIAGTTKKVPENYKALVSVVIPEGYTDIGNLAFYGCKNLESVTLPSTLQAIGDEAFSGCGKLKEIVIPASVRYIGGSAFYDCVSLSKVTIEKGNLTTLPIYAFSECNQLKEIELPENITTLSPLCLNCNSLTKVTIHARKLTVNDQIFGNTSPSIYAYKGVIKRIPGVTRNNIFVMQEEDAPEKTDVVQSTLVADGIFRFTPIESITFQDKIFVLTGFSATDEGKITNTIVSKGGIVKSSVVLKTDYLIVNSAYDHETSKYLKALELLEKGKNIAIISDQQFQTFS